MGRVTAAQQPPLLLLLLSRFCSLSGPHVKVLRETPNPRGVPPRSQVKGRTVELDAALAEMRAAQAAKHAEQARAGAATKEAARAQAKASRTLWQCSRPDVLARLAG